MKVRDLIIAATIVLAVPHAVHADDAHHGNTAAGAAYRCRACRRRNQKIDKGAGKVTIKHGPIKSLDMPAMTMVFQVRDPALLDQVKAGDKVNFVAEKIGGQYTVIRIEAAK